MASEAPELEKFLKKFDSQTVNYCAICLRTDSERKLIKNTTFKQFAAVMKMDNSVQDHPICYICERQASNALKFYKAAAFASAIHKIFQYILCRNTNIQNMFKTNNFKTILETLKMCDEKTSPSEWEAQLNNIRRMTLLNKTKTLIVDNKGAQVNTTIEETDPADIYVIPDDIPINDIKLQNSTENNNLIKPLPSILQKRLSLRVKSKPKRYLTDFVCNKESNKRKKNSSVVKEPVNDNVQPIVSDNNVSTHEPQLTETLVVLDDVEDKDPLQIRIEKVQSEAPPTNDTESPGVPNPSTPKLVPIEKLLDPNLSEQNFLVTQPPAQPNFVLHPIILNPQGMLVVPTLSVSLENGQLVKQNSLENTTLKDLIRKPQKEVAPLTKEAIKKLNVPKRRNVTSFEKFKLSADNGAKTKKDVNNVGLATPSKCTGLPVISDVRSEAPKPDRIDWEDKIPIDVISFVDAVDPNCSIKMDNMAPSIGLAQVCEPQAAPSNVIDLC